LLRFVAEQLRHPLTHSAGSGLRCGFGDRSRRRSRCAAILGTGFDHHGPLAGHGQRGTRIELRAQQRSGHRDAARRVFQEQSLLCGAAAHQRINHTNFAIDPAFAPGRHAFGGLQALAAVQQRQHVGLEKGLWPDIERKGDQSIKLVLGQRCQDGLANQRFNRLQVMVAQDEFSVRAGDPQAFAGPGCVSVSDDPGAIRQAGCARTEALEALDKLDPGSRRANWQGQEKWLPY
jgi:hypothetical protein